MKIFTVDLCSVNGGLILGIVLGIIYLVRASLKDNKPDMSKFFGIILSCFALMISLKLLIKVWDATPQYLGNLATEKEYILLGAVAVIYLSIKTVFDILELKIKFEFIKRLKNARR